MAIALSFGVRAALSSLQTTSLLANTAKLHLATGKKVNSAFENTRAFFLADSLTSRANALSGLLDDIGQATKVLDAASTGITGVNGLIDRAKAIITQVQQAAPTTARVFGTVSSLTSTTALILGIAAAKTVTVNDGVTTATLTVAAGNTVQTFLDTVNNTAGLKVKASLTSDGKIELEATGGRHRHRGRAGDHRPRGWYDRRRDRKRDAHLALDAIRLASDADRPAREGPQLQRRGAAQQRRPQSQFQ